MADIPVVVTSSGALPTPPATLLAALIAGVSAVRPGYTANLPASLIEDMTSTGVGLLAIADAARVAALNALNPFASNAYMLGQLGQIYIGPGAAPAPPTNTSVFVVFTGPPGFLINIGFTVTDGVFQYIVQDGGIIGAGGSSDSLFCLAVQTGTWSVPQNTVNQLVTSVPSSVTPAIACNNPSAGTPGDEDGETAADYRARVLQAGQAISTGTPQLLRTLLGQVPNVQQRLVSVRQTAAGWEILAGGGDPYAIGNAIYRSGINLQTITGSVLAITNITKAANGQITTDINHGYSPGQDATASGIVGMVGLNGLPFTVVSVIDEKNFTISISTLPFANYVSGGVLTPNLRNVEVSLLDYPDTYTFPFVNPPVQEVTVAFVWTTISTNFVSDQAMEQAAGQPIVDYVNSIVAGQPMSENALKQTFFAAVAAILPIGLFSSLIVSVSISGVVTAPTGDLYVGDPESFFETDTSQVTVAQGG